MPDALIRTVRRRQGISQQELARRAGTSQPVVSAYERGRRDPTFGTLRRLIEAGGERLVVDARPPGPEIPPARTDEERGARLLDVLTLVDAIPTRPAEPVLRAPRLVTR